MIRTKVSEVAKPRRAQASPPPADEKDMIPILTKYPEAMLAAIDTAWHARKLKSRSETIRVLLAEALAK